MLSASVVRGIFFPLVALGLIHWVVIIPYGLVIQVSAISAYRAVIEGKNGVPSGHQLQGMEPYAFIGQDGY